MDINPQVYDNEGIQQKSVDESSIGLINKEVNNGINNESTIPNGRADQTGDSQQIPIEYPGDYVEQDTTPLEKDGYQRLDFPDPALFISFYDKDIREGTLQDNGKPLSLHTWQVEELEKAANAKAKSQHPYKCAILTCNGSGKDKYIIAGWAVWFAACKIRSRTIITTSSGTQLTGQTEPHIKRLCQQVNEFHGCEIFRIRQRYIYCRLTGSEIRMFATDESGKAEGYHPMDPGSEMTIIINEAKTVTEEIHGALKRCNGYNYWFEISSAGEPFGAFHKAYTTWPNTRRVTSYDCSHISRSEIEADRIDMGEHSALFRSIHLALFTSLGGEVIITQELMEQLMTRFTENPVDQLFTSWEERIGIDLAAGGDENSIFKVKGNKCTGEYNFRETDTELTADNIDAQLKRWKISKTHKHIYADDGGVGRSIIDKLVRKGWKINRILNQQAASYKRVYGNRGAENWDRVKRILEERFFDVTTLSPKCREQLYTRHYKKSSLGGRIYLESKKEAKAEGRPSPDRADGFILALTGLTLDDFLKDAKGVIDPKNERPVTRLESNEAVEEYYENNVTFGDNRNENQKRHRIFCSLRNATNNYRN